MKTRIVLASVVGLLLLCAHGDAAKTRKQVMPREIQDSGFTVSARQREQGTVAFNITRDLASVPPFKPDSGLEMKRYARLIVSNKNGVLVECEPATEHETQTLVYRFVIARECLPYSRFTLSEVPTHKDAQSQSRNSAPGTFYEFRLAEF